MPASAYASAWKRHARPSTISRHRKASVCESPYRAQGVRSGIARNEPKRRMCQSAACTAGLLNTVSYS